MLWRFTMNIGLDHMTASPTPNPSQPPTASDLSFDGQIVRTGQLARRQLVRFSNLGPECCQETYLFREQHFCGIRYRMGRFTGTWYCGQTEIRFFREHQPLGTVSLDSAAAGKAA